MKYSCEWQQQYTHIHKKASVKFGEFMYWRRCKTLKLSPKESLKRNSSSIFRQLCEYLCSVKLLRRNKQNSCKLESTDKHELVLSTLNFCHLFFSMKKNNRFFFSPSLGCILWRLLGVKHAHSQLDANFNCYFCFVVSMSAVTWHNFNHTLTNIKPRLKWW